MDTAPPAANIAASLGEIEMKTVQYGVAGAAVATIVIGGLLLLLGAEAPTPPEGAASDGAIVETAGGSAVDTASPAAEEKTAEESAAATAPSVAATSTAPAPSDEPADPETASATPSPDVAEDVAVAAAPESDKAALAAEDADADAAPVDIVSGPLNDTPPAVDESDGAPVFDVVRIEPSGEGLVAGRAEPGATVEIVAGDEVVGSAVAAPDGGFVAFIQTDKTAEAIVVAARIGAEDTRPTLESAPVIVVPQEDAAPLIVSQSADDLDLIQPAPRAANAGVTLDAISYDETGRAVFAGRALAGASVRIYLNGAAVGETLAGDDTVWSTRAADAVAPGLYTLRVDQIDNAGKVQSRTETPFLRQSLSEIRPGQKTLTVQQGDNLWTIAEAQYGAGLRYTLIFGANQGAIIDPDLIYPGQVFTLPDAAAGE
ncbi:MAG: LysM peptidoglycan-binding domain-containing protein [Pseudomonadota bacterium]